MYLEEKKVVFIEQSPLNKNEFVVNLSTKSIILNDKEMHQQAIKWFLLKCEKIGNDILNKKAVVLEGDPA